jgi:hypothetical protein
MRVYSQLFQLPQGSKRCGSPVQAAFTVHVAALAGSDQKQVEKSSFAQEVAIAIVNSMI